ncbi:hypothetical protein HNV08_13675 [Winogradskyella eckloniae]|uniref:hypothetical protein n=1 Tax=Winogradskyella eckloniae TaxID=1089306 RepID=UPI0015642E8F|nr:hypothetical protein [Winogradskyella eckloniae]NRD21102.1 hypothetical protein [Winogradskyella eckloniae]
MKTKLHFGLLIVLLAFLGTFYEQNTVPNQQIVIQFSKDTTSIEDTENAIQSIQEKLKRIGVTDITIGQSHSGQLRITYFSEADVTQIQNALYSTENFQISKNIADQSSSEIPDRQNTNDYKLNISEIKLQSPIAWDLEGTQVVECNYKTDQPHTLKVQNSGNQVDTELRNGAVNTIVASYKTAAIAKNTSTYKIPEVRAGPLL